MSSVQTLQGTLRLDGTLELDNPPSVPPGRVEVVLRPLSPPLPTSPSGEGWWEYLQRVRREAETTGGPFRTEREIEKEREEFRSGDVRLDEVYRQMGQTPEGEPDR